MGKILADYYLIRMIDHLDDYFDLQWCDWCQSAVSELRIAGTFFWCYTQRTLISTDIVLIPEVRFFNTWMDKLENIQIILSFLVRFCESLCDYIVSFDKTTWWSSSLPSTFSLSRLSDPIFCLIRSRAMLLLCFCFLVVATSTTSSPLSEDVLRALHSQIEKVGFSQQLICILMFVLLLYLL